MLLHCVYFFPCFTMRTFAVSLIAVLSLTACQTSSLTAEQQAHLPEDADTFTGASSMEIDETRSSVSFTGKSNIINHEGKFNAYDIEIDLDEADPSNFEQATITAVIDIASVETDSGGLDGHLKRADFFDAEQFPQATFTSTQIVSTGENTYDITGDLTIKGTTKTVTFNAELTESYLAAHYDLPREDFGIGNDSYGEKLLEPIVPVDIRLVFAE